MSMNWIMVGMGGALGSMLRFAVFRSWTRWLTYIPVYWATLIVNVIGCFFIGYLYAYVSAKSATDTFKIFWMIGFLGGLTTFSTFGLDIFHIVQTRSFAFAAGYFLLHGLICIAMVYLGHNLFQMR